MHLDSLPIILDLREHAIRTLPHRILDGLAGLGLGVEKEKPGDRCSPNEELLSRERPRAQVLWTNCQDTPSRQAIEEVMSSLVSRDCILRNAIHCRENKIPLKQHFGPLPHPPII